MTETCTLRQAPIPDPIFFRWHRGGRIYVRDPFDLVDKEQLNGGEVVPMDEKDWDLILPYLQENERLFGISIEKDLLTVNGKQISPLEVYRKVRPIQAVDTVQDGLEEWGG